MAELVRRLKGEGRPVVDLTWGAPHLPPPPRLLELASRHLNDVGEHSYGPGRGEASLRAAIAADLRAFRSWQVSPDRELLVVPGGKMGAFLALAASLERGDEVLIPEPFWVSYPDLVRMCGGVPVQLPSSPESGFNCTPDQIRRAVGPRTAGMILNSPNNPSGALLTPAHLDAIEEIAPRLKFILSDEVYDRILFDGRAHLSLWDRPSLRARCLLINSFSKTCAVPGWRLGYVLAAPERIERLLDLQLQTATCMPAFLQKALARFLPESGAFVEYARTEYQVLRDRFCEAASGIPGLSVFPPGGAFYALISSRACPDGDQFARRLLEECLIGTVPGSAYGESTRGWVRMCFARPEADLDEAVNRLRGWRP